MLSSIPKLNRTAKEIILIQKKTSALYLQLFSVSEYFSALRSQLYYLLAKSGGKSATEYAQTTARQPKEEEALPLLSTEQPDIWPKIRLGNGIWAKFGLGNGIYTPTATEVQKTRILQGAPYNRLH